jgi:hypothetical protein
VLLACPPETRVCEFWWLKTIASSRRASRKA